jgi:pyruvate formate lyase activating enzyme
MKIVNVLSETYLEYEDHLSIVLFCFGCNLHCNFCYNHSYVSDPANILLETAEQIIDRCYNPLVDGLVFLGGEPTLYPDRMKEIALYAKQKYELDVKLFTNGTNPQVVLRGLREGWLDQVSVDFKTVTDDSLFRVGSNPYARVRYLLDTTYLENLQDRVEVRTTFYSSMPDGELEEIVDYCKGLGIKHLTQTEFEVWAT